MNTLHKIRARREALAAQRRAIDEEEHELQIAERVYLRFGESEVVNVPAVSTLPTAFATWSSQSKIGPATTEEFILVVLSNSASPWLTSSEVREEVSRRKGKEVPMGTVGPTLTAMKNDGKILRDGHKVALSSRATSNGSHATKELSPFSGLVPE